MNNARLAFVTGATGAVGLALVRALIDRGWQVHALHRASSDTTALQSPGVTLVEGDIRDTGGIVGKIAPGTDLVFHVAASLSVWSHDDRDTLKTNAEGTRNVVNAALHAGVGRFVHTSTISAYGRVDAPIAEDTPSVAEHSFICYERSKWLAESEVREGIARGLDAVILNPCAIMGPGFSAGWARLLFQIKAGKLPALPPGDLVVNHINDVVAAHIAAAELGRKGENYILGGDPVAVAALIRHAAMHMGVELKAPVINARLLGVLARIANGISRFTGREPDITPEMAAMMSQHLRCNTDKAQRELGFQVTPWQQCVEEMYAWLRQREMI